MNTTPPAQTMTGNRWYERYLILISGLGGLLYGIDVGIIAAALLYLNKTVNLTVEQTSAVVAAVLGGGMVSSPITGLLADWIGRKRMMIIGGFIFVSSVGIIVLSQGFVPLLVGRLLQGLSGGVIAVAVPLFLAESLSPEMRGRGTGIFQFMLTVGIVMASLTGFLYTRHAEAAIAAAHGNPALILAAENHAWRGMFLSVVYPGILFFIGCFFVSETPRWLFRKGRREAALAALRRSCSEPEAATQLQEMEALSVSNQAEAAGRGRDSLLQRRYVLPFILACLVLGLNQTTGINSILAFLVIILRQAGMSASHATAGDVIVKVLNMVMTIVGVALVDRRGRRFLLKMGTSTIVLSLLAGAIVFYTFESKRTDLTGRLQQAVVQNRIDLPLAAAVAQKTTARKTGAPQALTVVYDAGSGSQSTTVLSTDADPTIRLAATPGRSLKIQRAALSPIPSEAIGWLVAACLAVFIAGYAAGPGVVVWLMLSELMPTRIRSAGMGIALLINQGLSTLIAGVFLPVVGDFGYFAMFLFWSACTALYLAISVWFLPETKGKSLEEIEAVFETKTPFQGSAA